MQQSVSDARTDARFGCLWQAIVASAEINESIDGPRLPRLRKVPVRLDDNAESVFFSRTAKDAYRQMYFSVLDSVLLGVSDRLEPDETAVHCRRIERFLIGKEANSDYISQHYADDLDCIRLKLHRDMLLKRAKSQGCNLEDFESTLSYLIEQKAFCEIIPEVNKLFRLVSISPVSSCTAERSFSGLRRLKTYLRYRVCPKSDSTQWP